MVPCTLDNEDHQRNMKSESVLGQRGPLACWALCTYSWLNSPAKCYGTPRTRGARPLHLRSSMTDSGCLFSISLRLSSNCTPSVGRRRFWTKGSVDTMSTGRTKPLPSSPYRPGPQHCCLGPDASAIQRPGSQQPFPSDFLLLLGRMVPAN